MPRLLALALTFLAASLAAGEPIRFGRTPDISPDGKRIVFSYLGDLWTVGAEGGPAQHLTMHEKHDFNPVFSPDGKKIAFSSNRHGSYDVFVMPVEGGRPTRLTHDSADDHVTGWSPDGQRVLFMSSRAATFPPRVELYAVLATGGYATPVSAFEGRDGAYSPKGDKIAYVRGPGTWYRKGYHGSSNDDLWLSNADGTANRQLTTHNGQDNYPNWAPDGLSLYYVSDTLGGPANVVELPIDPNPESPAPASTVPVAVTRHKDEAVRRARVSRNGQWIVYECGPDLWLHSIEAGKGLKLNIEVHADDKTNPDKIENYTSGATEFALSHDERHIAFVVHGEIFLMPRAGGKAQRLTDSPAFDHGIAWSPDSKKLLFLSDRGGHEDVFLLEADDPEHPKLVEAHRFKAKQLTHTPEAELGISFAPDGRRVGFLRAGRLMTMNPDGSDEKTIVKEGQVFDYEWSPDGKWICYARSNSNFASELYVIPAGGATGTEPARNVTRFATYNGGVTWSKTGNRLAFISQRHHNTASAYVLSLEKPGTASAKSGFDWDDVHLRVKQPASMTVSECAISGDGTKIAFRATQDGDDLWVANVNGGQVTRLTTGSVRPTQIQWSRLFGSHVAFRDGSGQLRTLAIGSGKTDNTLSTIPFQARMVVRQEELFAEMFEQSWRALNETFYDPLFHGADWSRVRQKYRPLVKHVVCKEDLYSLISLMLGELNASHLGISGTLGTPDQFTAELGLIFDRQHKGPGLRIAEIVKNGPADRRGLHLKPGDIVSSIDDTTLDETTDLAELLNDKAGEAVTLYLAAESSGLKPRRRVEITPTTHAKMSALMCERWVRGNAERVRELSGNTLGYIHIPNMKEEGLERFLRVFYSDCFDKDGIVLDVRYNGGGHTHEQVLNYLNGKEHTFFQQRDGQEGLSLNAGDRKWTKPLTLLINNRSYSDAEIFPHAFRMYGLGKLVGQATGGHVIGTREVRLIDGSSFRTPRIGVRTHKGINMEKEGVVPDITVDVHPDQLANGEDPQLVRAVQVLKQDVAAWKKSRPAVANRPSANEPPTAGADSTPMSAPMPPAPPARPEE